MHNLGSAAVSTIISSVTKTGLSTLTDKLLSVKDTYNLNDKKLEEMFPTKDRTSVEKTWWQIYSTPIDVCHEVFTYYTKIFDEKERAALDIDITFQVEAHYFFFNSKVWSGKFSSDQALKDALEHKFSKDSIAQRAYGLVEQYCKDKKTSDQGFFNLSTIKEKDIGARFIFKLIQSIAHCTLWQENPKKQIKAYEKSKQFLTQIQTIKRLSAPGSNFAMLCRSIEKAIDYEIQALSQIDEYHIKEWLRKIRENLENITGQTLLLIHSYIQLTDKLPHDLSIRINFLGEEWKNIFYGDEQKKIHITEKRKLEILAKQKEILSKKDSLRTLEEKGFIEDYHDFSTECNEYTANQSLRELFFDCEAIENETRRVDMLPEWILAMYETSLNDHIFLKLWKNRSQISQQEDMLRKEYLFRVFKSHVLHPDLIIKMLQEIENGTAPPTVDKQYLENILAKSVSLHLDNNKESKAKDIPKEVFPIFKITCHPDFAKTYRISHGQLESAANKCYQALCNLEIITTRLCLLRWSIAILYEQAFLIGQFGMIVNAHDLLKQLANLMTDYIDRFKKELTKIEKSGYKSKIDEAVNNKGSENTELADWNSKLKITRQTVTYNIQESIENCHKLIKKLPKYIGEEKAIQVAHKIESQSRFIHFILQEMRDDLREEWHVVEDYKKKNQKYLGYLLQGLKKPANPNKEKNLLEVKQLLSTLSPSDQGVYVKELVALLTPFNILQTNTSKRNPHDAKKSPQDICEQFIFSHIKKIPIGFSYEPSQFIEDSEENNFFQLKNKYKDERDWKSATQKVFQEHWHILHDTDKYESADRVLIYRIAKFSVFRDKLYLECNDCVQESKKNHKATAQFQVSSLALDKEIKFLTKITEPLESPIKKLLIDSVESLSKFKEFLDQEAKKFEQAIPHKSIPKLTHSTSTQLIFPKQPPVKITKIVDDAFLKIKSEKDVSIKKTYHALLSLWGELVNCEQKNPQDLLSDEKLKTKLLATHEMLLEKPKASLPNTLRKLILKEIRTEDYFSCLINSEMLILNLKLNENNIINFVKEILPEYLCQLKTSELFEAPHTIHTLTP